VKPAIVLDRPGLAALVPEQVLGQELLDRLIESDVPILPALREPADPNLGDEGCELAGGVRLGARAHCPVEAPRRSVGVVAGGHGELPDARPDLLLRTAAARCAGWTRVRRRLSTN
jgi:hypothetical protein